MSEPVKTVHWGRRIALALAILILALLTAHALWTSVAASRLNQRLAALKQAGEPVDPSELLSLRIEPATNAGVDILAAAELVHNGGPEWADFHELELELPLPDDQRQTLESLVKANSAAIERLEAARGKAGLEWAPDPDDPTGWQSTSPSRLNLLAQILGAQAILDHNRGDDRAAIDRFEQALKIGRFTEMGPTLLSHLLARLIDDQTTRFISLIAPELRIGNEPTDASAESVRRMIDTLFDDGSVRQGLLQGLQGERAVAIRALRTGGGFSRAQMNPVMRYLLRPVMLSAGSSLIEYHEGLQAAAAEQSYPAATAKLHKVQYAIASLNQLERQFIPTFDGQIQMVFMSLTNRHFTGLALAIRAYALDHGGQFPAKLDDLVPSYISAVPKDLFNVRLPPLGYLPGSAVPVVYSVGDDGTDNGGVPPRDLVYRLPTTNPQP